MIADRIKPLQRRSARCLDILAAVALLGTGCVHSVVSSHPTGPLASNSPQHRASSPPTARNSASKPSPADSVHQTVRQQTEGAADSLSDDGTVRTLLTRLRLNPDDLSARLELAQIYERFGLADDALEQYRQALNVNTSSDESAAPVLEASQMDAAAEGLARTARAASRGPEAVPLLEAYLKRISATSIEAGVWNELGMLYDDTRDLASAERAFRQAMARTPSLEEPHNNLGYNLLLQNRPEAAEAEFRRAIELNPKSAAARNNLGAVLARRGDRDAAFEQFRLAASDDATAHNNLAVVLLEMGYYERSRDELIKALAARYYFAPPVENFKLVQELLRQRSELIGEVGRLPLRPLRIPPSLELAAGLPVTGIVTGPLPAANPDLNSISPREQDRRPAPQRDGAESNVSEDRQ